MADTKEEFIFFFAQNHCKVSIIIIKTKENGTSLRQVLHPLLLWSNGCRKLTVNDVTLFFFFGCIALERETAYQPCWGVRRTYSPTMILDDTQPARRTTSLCRRVRSCTYLLYVTVAGCVLFWFQRHLGSSSETQVAHAFGANQ